MTELEVMKLNPNTTLKSFEEAIREDELQIISDKLGLEIVRPSDCEIAEAVFRKIKIIETDALANIIGFSFFSATVSAGVSLLILNLQ